MRIGLSVIVCGLMGLALFFQVCVLVIFIQPGLLWCQNAYPGLWNTWRKLEGAMLITRERSSVLMLMSQ